MATGSPEIDEELKEWLKRFNAFYVVLEQHFVVVSIFIGLGACVRFSF